ncbi:MAG: cyclic nucleotide-binding domain-containing protein [Terriglobia bacterium]|nr:cyclic nucleotide-binding domain-containing protein [Terriglobia bacterium]
MTVNFGNSQPCSPFQLSPELLQALQPLSDPVASLRNDIIVRQGADCRGVYIIQNGLARVSILADDGREIFKRLLGPGCVIGLPATLCSTPYNFSAHCEADCTFRFVAAPEFLDFIRTRPVLGMEVVRLMGQELSEMNQHRTNFQNCRACGCPLADICEHELGDPNG